MNYIRKAAERLPGHWYKGGLKDNHGNYCGIGWLELMHKEAKTVDVNAEGWWPQGTLMDEVAMELYYDRVVIDNMRPFAVFNDHPDTTEDEVIAVMEKAAIRWDEQV